MDSRGLQSRTDRLSRKASAAAGLPLSFLERHADYEDHSGFLHLYAERNPACLPDVTQQCP